MHLHDRHIRRPEAEEAAVIDPVGFNPMSAIYAEGEERRERVRELVRETFIVALPVIRRDVAREIAEALRERAKVPGRAGYTYAVYDDAADFIEREFGATDG